MEKCIRCGYISETLKKECPFCGNAYEQNVCGYPDHVRQAWGVGTGASAGNNGGIPGAAFYTAAPVAAAAVPGGSAGAQQNWEDVSRNEEQSSDAAGSVTGEGSWLSRNKVFCGIAGALVLAAVIILISITGKGTGSVGPNDGKHQGDEINVGDTTSGSDQEATYQTAISLYAQKQFEAARLLFSSLGKYKDSELFLHMCDDELTAGQTPPETVASQPMEDLTKASHLLRFDGVEGGDGVRELEEGAYYGQLPVMVREGYTFLGWFTRKSGGVEVTENSVMGPFDVTVYAHWKEIPQETAKATTAPAKPTQPPTQAPDPKTYTVVNTDYLTLRQNPKTSAKAITKLKPGDVVTVIEYGTNGFWRVKFGTYEGYVLPSYLSANKGTKIPDPLYTMTTTDTLSLRDIPGSNGDKLLQIPAGAKVQFYSTAENNYCLVRYNGQFGYVNGNYLQ